MHLLHRAMRVVRQVTGNDLGEGARSVGSMPNIAVVFLYGVFGLSSWIVSMYSGMDRTMDRFMSPVFDNQDDSFDFIVVGSGTAGGVVAARLAENFKVLLLEAGGEFFPLSAIPGMSLYILNYPQVDWMYKTVPQKKSCYSLPNQQSGWSSGKGLGGTSNINFLIHVRGNKMDYDHWSNLTGDPQWDYESLLPFFKMSEDFHGEYENDGTHGKKGPMRIQIPPYIGIAETFIDAGQELGYPRNDLNGRFVEGFDTIFMPIKNGKRQQSYTAYIQPNRRNPNLVVRKFSHVTKILIRDEDKVAFGVEYERHGRKKVAYAGKEVIVSAGAIASPKLLMLSGIGPRKHLEELGIPVKSDLPVGENLQDHISTYLGPFILDKPAEKTRPILVDRDFSFQTLMEWFTQGTGFMTTSGCQATGFFSSEKAKKAGEGNWPDLQVFLLGVATYQQMYKHFSHGFGPKEDILKKYWAHAEGKDTFLIITSLGRPKQRGDIKLASTDPFEDPIIDPKYLENDEDVATLIEGVKKAVDLVENTTAFQNLGGRFTDEPFPGCETVPFRSDLYWECFIRQFSITLHHIVGTCSMGKDGEGVVDTQLRVKGIKNLRVIDASIMPKVVVGNTNAPTVMIGEKGADLVKNTWLNSVEL